MSLLTRSTSGSISNSMMLNAKNAGAETLAQILKEFAQWFDEELTHPSESRAAVRIMADLVLKYASRVTTLELEVETLTSKVDALIESESSQPSKQEAPVTLADILLPVNGPKKGKKPKKAMKKKGRK